MFESNNRNRSTFIIEAALTVVLCISSSLAAWAGNCSELRFKYASNSVQWVDRGEEQWGSGSEISSTMAIKVLPGDKFQLVIEDYNPLLWKYEVKVEKEETKEYNEAKRFANILSKFLEILKPSVADVETKAFLEDSSKMKAAGLDPDLEVLSRTIDDIESWVYEADSVIRQSLTHASKSRDAVTGWQIDTSKVLLKGYRAKLAEIDREALANPDPDAAAVRGLLLRALDRTETKLEMLAAVKTLLLKTSESKVLKGVEIDPRKKVTVTVTFKETDHWPSGLSVDPSIPDTVVIEIKPRLRIDLNFLAPAAVYSFVKNPEYEAVADGDKFRIHLTEEEYRELDVAMMMMISPRAWDFDNVRFHGQLGVTPTDDPGLYAGFAMGVYDLFTIGGGVAFQRVNKLGSGLAVDQLIDAEDDLKIDKHFKTGFYLHITVPLSFKKDG
jgi:hypothetical protein